MNFLHALSNPWPWYIAGPIIGLMVPLLLILGNKSFGISSSLRHICAVCFPANIPFFKYDWKKELWNLFMAGGVIIGGFIAAYFLKNPAPMKINLDLAIELNSYGIVPTSALIPETIFNWGSLFTMKGFLMMIVGGFFVGFGTRYAGGCTSGHSIMGLSTLQWPSLIATICFMLGGFIMANLILPHILSL
ncbi:MAG: YeeE/YedE thiosulfate transporter family protein [Saprospiraceae bacterium]